MTGFEHFIYMLGAVTLAGAVPAAMFWIIGKVEQPERRRK